MWIFEAIDRELASVAAARALSGGSSDLIDQLLDERSAFMQMLCQGAEKPNEFRTAAGPLTTEHKGSVGGP